MLVTTFLLGVYIGGALVTFISYIMTDIYIQRIDAWKVLVCPLGWPIVMVLSLIKILTR